MDQRPQAAAGRAEPEDVPVQTDRRQSLNQRRRYYREEGDGRAEQQCLDSVLPADGYCFLRNGLPLASFRLSVAIMMTSTSHQIPHPPPVSSFRTPKPMYPM